MAMLNFFNQGFKATKCKTLLKLTIPRIKLLRNRRETQIKIMRRDISKLLETGQEATARIRVEHIIREENIMATQEILELFCELITVRLPIIEAQRECPLDLKEAISSVCFAAPRCADLPELLQVQIAFGMKYGKEFVDSASELRPDCGVNRQLIELLSIRAPSPEKKLKLLKEIAEEHDLDWDSSAAESEFLKPREDLLNGPSQFTSGSKLPLPEEKPDDTLNSISEHAYDEHPESDVDFDQLDLPEVLKVALRPSGNAASAPEAASTMSHALNPCNHEPANHPTFSENRLQESHLERDEVLKEETGAFEAETLTTIEARKEEQQFVPFITLPSQSSIQYSSPKPTNLSAPTLRAVEPFFCRTSLTVDRDSNLNLDDVLAAAEAAAESAELAASAARSAATLAQARITELTKKSGDKSPETGNENPFHTETLNHQLEDPELSHQQSFGRLSNDSDNSDRKSYLDHEHSFADSNKSLKFDDDHEASGLPDLSSFNKLRLESDPPHTDQALDKGSASHPPQRLPSMDDDYFSYPNLFSSQKSGVGSNVRSSKDDTDTAP